MNNLEDKGVLFNPQRLRSLLKNKGIDVSVIVSPENIYYLSQYRSPLYPISGDRSFVVFPTEKDLKPSLIINICEGFTPFSQPTEISDIRFYGEFYFYFSEELSQQQYAFKKASDMYCTKGIRDEISVLKENIESQGFQMGVIGIEGSMPTVLKHALEKALPKAEFQDVTPVFQEARMIKTQEEIMRLRNVAQVNEKALQAAVEMIHVGVSEWELVMAYREESDRHKAEPIFHLINAGRGSGDLFPTHEVTRKLKKGDIIRLDVGCKYKGYCSDVSRSVALGGLSSGDENIRQAILDGYWETINALRPGLAVKDVFQEAVERIRKAGIPRFRRSNVGHGIGLSVHELPNMSPSSDRKLEKDMILNIETPYYGIGIGGFQQEDTVRITDAGVELLTHLDRDIRISG